MRNLGFCSSGSGLCNLWLPKGGHLFQGTEQDSAEAEAVTASCAPLLLVSRQHQERRGGTFLAGMIDRG